VPLRLCAQGRVPLKKRAGDGARRNTLASSGRTGGDWRHTHAFEENIRCVGSEPERTAADGRWMLAHAGAAQRLRAAPALAAYHC
jgi:hypothetical protein